MEQVNTDIVRGIYKITNIANGLFYIGQSTNIYNRWKQHKKDLKNGTHSGGAFQYDYDVFGEKVFIYEIVEDCANVSDYEIMRRELYYIENLHPQYNATEEYKYNNKTMFKKWMRSIYENLIVQVNIDFDPSCINDYKISDFTGITKDDLRFITRYSKGWVGVYVEDSTNIFLQLGEESLFVVNISSYEVDEIKIHTLS